MTTTREPRRQAVLDLDEADRLASSARVCRTSGAMQSASVMAARERLALKRAEVNALLAIADELARIGLGR